MDRNIVETLMGAVVILIAVAFILTSYKSANITSISESYVLHAKFKDIGTLSIGSDVRVGGIKVGTVSKQYLDPAQYMAVIEINILNSLQLPKDSSAIIASDGLLGGKYLTIEPGADDRFLREGDEIKYTQDAINIESLIGKFAFGSIGNTPDVSNGESSSNF